MAKKRVNRWGREYGLNDYVTVHHPRGGTYSGNITRIFKEAGRGTVIEIDHGMTASADDIKTIHAGNGELKRNPAAKIPPLKWNTFAGGTGAAPGKYAYQAITGRLNGREMYLVDPVSYSSGRHAHYSLKYFGTRGYEDLGAYRSPQGAKAHAKTHWLSINGALHVAIPQPYRNPRELRRSHREALERPKGRSRIVTALPEGKTPLARGAYRRYSKRNIRVKNPAPYQVQVKRGNVWRPLGAFYQKQMAIDYGRTIAARYRRQRFRVFWPDELRKNPAPRNPADAAPELDQAAKLFRQFTGHNPSKARRVQVPRSRAALAVGPLLAVAYETVRDGKRERYMHEFRRGARPTLAASHDGRILYVLGGAYRFTERGIVDKT